MPETSVPEMDILVPEKENWVPEMAIWVPETKISVLEEAAALTLASYTTNWVNGGGFWPLKAIFSNN